MRPGFLGTAMQVVCCRAVTRQDGGECGLNPASAPLDRPVPMGLNPNGGAPLHTKDDSGAGRGSACDHEQAGETFCFRISVLYKIKDITNNTKLLLEFKITYAPGTLEISVLTITSIITTT